MIFGSSGSKFYCPDTSTTVFLSHSVIEPIWFNNDFDVNEGILGNKINTWVTHGYYSEFKVFVNIHDYPIPYDAFTDLYSYNQKEVQFFPHFDGEPIKNATATDTASFYVEVKVGARDKYNQYNYLEINFKPTSYTTINEKSSAPAADINNGFPFFFWEELR